MGVGNETSLEVCFIYGNASVLTGPGPGSGLRETNRRVAPAAYHCLGIWSGIIRCTAVQLSTVGPAPSHRRITSSGSKQEKKREGDEVHGDSWNAEVVIDMRRGVNVI